MVVGGGPGCIFIEDPLQGVVPTGDERFPRGGGGHFSSCLTDAAAACIAVGSGQGRNFGAVYSHEKYGLPVISLGWELSFC